MSYPEITYRKEKALSLIDFRDMDYYAVEHFSLPVALMMENAGLHLARLISDFANKNDRINIGIGNGNNGGGGLVAARRLAAWGYQVNLDLYTDITKALPAIQLKRVQKFGVKTIPVEEAEIWVDAFLGFSQRLPLDSSLLSILEKTNNSSSLKISLDIPTGFLGDIYSPHFKPDKVLTLAAPKSILYNLPSQTEIYIADIGIPKKVYQKFKTDPLPFEKGSILKLKN